MLVTVWIREGLVKEWEKTKVKPEFGGNCEDSDVISGDRKHRKLRRFGEFATSEVPGDSQETTQGGQVDLGLCRDCGVE